MKTVETIDNLVSYKMNNQSPKFIHNHQHYSTPWEPLMIHNCFPPELLHQTIHLKEFNTFLPWVLNLNLHLIFPPFLWLDNLPFATRPTPKFDVFTSNLSFNSFEFKSNLNLLKRKTFSLIQQSFLTMIMRLWRSTQ